MNSYTTWGFTSPNIISWGDSVFDSFITSIEEENFQLHEGDIIIITSKVVSMEEEAAVQISNVNPSDKALKLSEECKLHPKVVQIIIDESDEIYGSVFHAILTNSKYGLSANAGIDLSNAPEGYALLLPRDPSNYAFRFREKINKKFGIKTAILITDSRTIPLKKGTTGVTIGLAGMKPIIDERGKTDLYGYKMTITTKAIADNLATIANVIMGETAERRPFAVIRGIEYEHSEEKIISMDETMMPEDQCLYFAPLFKILKGSS